MFATLKRLDPPVPVKVNPRHVMAFEPLGSARYDEDDAEAEGNHRAIVGTRLILSNGSVVAVAETLTQVERALDGRVG
jgi:hypothetical protein